MYVSAVSIWTAALANKTERSQLGAVRLTTRCLVESAVRIMKRREFRLKIFSQIWDYELWNSRAHSPGRTYVFFKHKLPPHSTSNGLKRHPSWTKVETLKFCWSLLGTIPAPASYVWCPGEDQAIWEYLRPGRGGAVRWVCAAICCHRFPPQH